MIRSSWRPALAAAAAAATALGAAACGTVLGLDDYGDAPGDSGVDSVLGSGADGSAGEGSPPAPDDATIEAMDGSRADAEAGSGDMEAAAMGDAGAGADADGGLDAGWTRVAFASTPQATCPAGFSSVPESVVYDTSTATPAANACACDSCSITSTPSCVTGRLSGAYDLNGGMACGVSFSLSNTNAGGCNTDNPHVTLSNLDQKWTPLPPTGGACAASPTAHADRVSFSQHGAICTAVADAGALPAASPFLDCIATAGNVPCPAGPLGVAHFVGAAAALSCSGTCSCAVSATCQNGLVTYFKNSTCTNTAGATMLMPADGNCDSVGGGGSTYGSYMYSATLSASCNATGTPTATVTGLASEQTICCAQ